MAIHVFLCLWAFLVCGVYTATPDKASILAQLRRNGACCTALDWALPGKVHFNLLTDLEYQASQQSFWSAQEKSLQPNCIVVPTTAQDVSVAVTILNVAYQANVSGCKFAVRGAGHTPQAGAANIHGGVTIDMQSMNQVVVSGDRKRVSIGAGNRWENVYPTLDSMNLVMVGGRVSPVGAGGLISGGGISYFSGRYGFACDRIEAFQIVLANGTITTASSSTNPTLFRALKGGSNNFGVITRFDATLYPQTEFWGGQIAHPITNKDALIDYFTNFTVSENYDPYSAFLWNVAWVSGVPVTILHNVIYTNGDATWPPPAFAALEAMPKLSTTVRKAKLTSFTDELDTTASITNGRNNLLSTLTFVNKADVTQDFMAEVFELANAAALELLTVVGLAFTMTFQPLPYVLYSKSSATGGNVLGLDRFDDDLANLLFTLSWQLPIDNARVEARMQKLESDIVALEKQMGLFNEFVYLNYAAGWQDPIQAYGTQNVQFLRSVSRTYDPTGLFQKGVPGGFKLGI